MIDHALLAHLAGEVERGAASCPEADVIELLRPILEPVAEANPSFEQARQWCTDQRRAHGWHTQQWWTPDGILQFVWMPSALGVQLLENRQPTGLYVAASDLVPCRSTVWEYDQLAAVVVRLYGSQGSLL